MKWRLKLKWKVRGTLRGLHDLLTKKWYIAGTLSAFPAIVGIVLTNLGISANYVDPQGNLLPPFNYLAIGLLSGFLLFTYLTYFESARKKASLLYGQKLVEEVLHSTNSIVTKKHNSLCDALSECSDLENPLSEVYTTNKPEKQLEVILDGLRSCLTALLKRNDGESVDVAVSVIFKIPGAKKWEWIKSASVDDGITLDQLIGEDAFSSIKPIIYGSESLVFYEDKRLARDKRIYVESPLDEACNSIGSIVCYKADVGRSKSVIPAIICFSTYGQQISEVGDPDARGKVKTVLMPFVTRIKFELTALYIKRLDEKTATLVN